MKKVLCWALILAFLSCLACAAQEQAPLFDQEKGWGPPEYRIKVKLYTDRPNYKVGEQAKIAVVADYDCYFLLYSISSTGNCAIVVPSTFSSYNKLKKNQVFYIRDNQGNFLQQKGPAGKESLQVIASRDPIELKKFAANLDMTSPVVMVNRPREFVDAVSQEISKRVDEEEKAWAFNKNKKNNSQSSGQTTQASTSGHSSGQSSSQTSGSSSQGGHSSSVSTGAQVIPESSSKPAPKPVYGIATVNYEVR